jgi:hypothetical protein
MKALGILLIAFGGIDLLGSWFFEFDLWGGGLGIELPGIIWTFSGYIEVGVGWLILKAGTKEAGTEEAGTEEAGTGVKMMSGQLPKSGEGTDLGED